MTGERAVGGPGPGAAEGKTGKGEEHLFRGPRLPPTHPHTGERAAGRKGIKTLHFHPFLLWRASFELFARLEPSHKTKGMLSQQ